MIDFIAGVFVGRLLILSPYFDQIGALLLFLLGVWLGHIRTASSHYMITIIFIGIVIWWTFPWLSGLSPHQCIGFR